MVVGDTTYGKGLVQGYFRSPRGDGLRLTISRYFFDGGLYLNEFDSALVDTGHGLVPDAVTSSGSRVPFVRALEGALVLEPFANRHHEGLVRAIETGSLDSGWVIGLRCYAADRGFVYESRRTQLARLLCEWAEAGRSSGQTARVAEQVRGRSEALDDRVWLEEQRYILTRLAQLAFEREYSVYRAYRDILLKDDPEVAVATALLFDADAVSGID